MVKKGMVSLSFSSFLFGLFVSISLHSFAFSQKDMEKQVVVPAITLLTGRNPNLSLQKLQEIFNAVPTRAEAGIEQVSGRKTMEMRRVLKKKEVVKEAEGSTNIIVKTKISSATSSDDIKGKGSNKLQKIDRNLRDRRHSRSIGRRHRRLMASFVAMNADYKAPQFHPPRNN